MDVLCLAFDFSTVWVNNVSNLRLVANRSLAWVTAEFNQEQQHVIVELPSRDHVSLRMLPEFSGAWPTNESIGRTR